MKEVIMKRDADSFIEFLFCSNEYLFLKDLSNEHFVRATSKLRYLV